jgi:hypothetical protein
LDELPSDRENELLKETPVPVPALTKAITPATATTAQAEDDQQPRLVLIRRSGQRINSGPDSEEELQLEAEEDEAARKRRSAPFFASAQLFQVGRSFHVHTVLKGINVKFVPTLNLIIYNNTSTL